MQFSLTVLSSALIAALAIASPIEERAALTTVNLYSDANCGNRIQTLTVQNRTCVAATNTFNSLKVAANPQSGIGEVRNVTGCGAGDTKVFVLNNTTRCVTGFISGSGKFINGLYPSNS